VKCMPLCLLNRNLHDCLLCFAKTLVQLAITAYCLIA
jgi:hypothetical protein